MALIRDALSSLPAKPALFIAPLLIVLVLSLYYHDRYIQCVGIRQARAELNQRLSALGSGEPFRLADFTAFAWDRVRVVASVKPGTIDQQCPFGWNWPTGERDSLIAAGKLTALIFGRQGKIAGYLELRNDEVSFRGADGELTPQSAVFDITRPQGRGDGVTLTLQHDHG